jgi:hypothetical protein
VEGDFHGFEDYQFFSISAFQLFLPPPRGCLGGRVAGAGGFERAEVVAERAVEDAAFSGGEDEGHRVVFPVGFGSGFGEHPDFRIPGKAGVEFVGGGEILDAGGGGVAGLRMRTRKSP